MKQIIAMHGWCEDSQTWKEWLGPFKQKNWIWQSGERGYGELQPSMPSWLQDSQHDKDQRRVFIGHSLGAHLIQKETLQQATDIIFLSSFGKFLPRSLETNYLETALKIMLKKIGGSEEEVMIESFLRKSYKPLKVDQLANYPLKSGLSKDGRERLKFDLNLLIKTNKLPEGINNSARVLVVQGTKDAILIPPIYQTFLQDLIRHLDKQPIYLEVGNGGHTISSLELIKQMLDWLEQ